MRLVDILIEPKFASVLERQYSMTSIVARERNLATAFYQLSLGAPLIYILFYFIGLIANKEGLILIGLHVSHAFFALFMLRKSTSTRVLCLSFFYGSLICQLIWLAAARIDVMDGVGSRWLAGAWIFTYFTINTLMPFRARVHHFTLVYFFLTFLYGFQNFPEPEYGIAIAFVLTVVAQNIQIFSHRIFKINLIQSFRDQSRYIPRQILMQSAREGKAISTVFAPANRYCVCICSDWRNYQATAVRESPESLSTKIELYYRHVLNELGRIMPEGNYFLDWIADELFIVIFAIDERRDQKLTSSAFQVANWLLHHRVDFALQHGYPRGIDVGVASGIASVGVFGPPGIAKATAFGETPGQARRLQSAGKHLREIYGDTDRIVMTPDLGVSLNNDGISTSELSLVDKLSVRDVANASAFIYPAFDHRPLKYQWSAPALKLLKVEAS